MKFLQNFKPTEWSALIAPLIHKQTTLDKQDFAHFHRSKENLPAHSRQSSRESSSCRKTETVEDSGIVEA